MGIFSGTVFEYFYRDRDNYKSHARVILRGDILPSHADRLKKIESFIPSQVGLEDLQMQMISGSDDLSQDFFGPGGPDHAMHEISDIYGTNDPATENIQAEELFEKIIQEDNKGWDEAAKAAINRIKSEIEKLKTEVLT